MRTRELDTNCDEAAIGVEPIAPDVIGATTIAELR